MRQLYCDECQLPRNECDPNCPGRIEREYLRELSNWEASPDWVETPPY